MRQTQNTQKNSNKKSVFVIALLLLLVAVIGFGGYTMSKYVSSKSDKGTANVAKWGFTVNADVSKVFGSNYEMKAGNASSTVTNETDATKLTVKASGDSKLVAPGTTGSMTFGFGGTSEVLAEFTFDLKVTDISLAYTKGGVAGTYSPIKWTLNDGTTNVVNGGTIEDVKGALNKKETLKPGDTLENKSYTLTWVWDFETSDASKKTEYNILDTYLGKLAHGYTEAAYEGYTKTDANTTLTINLDISVVQLQNRA